MYFSMKLSSFLLSLYSLVKILPLLHSLPHHSCPHSFVFLLHIPYLTPLYLLHLITLPHNLPLTNPHLYLHPSFSLITLTYLLPLPKHHNLPLSLLLSHILALTFLYLIPLFLLFPLLFP